MKTCTKCQKTKPLFDFYKNAASQDGKQPSCKECAKKYFSGWRKDNPNYFTNWRKDNPGYHTNDWYIRKYGLTTEQVQQMVEDQEGKCAICDTELQGGRLQAVDHCHTTNKVRAILCHGCNTGLGLFRDNTDSLRKAAEYLEQHRGENPTING